MSNNGEQVPGVYAKINEVMAQVGRIRKTGRNDFHNYDYVEESEIVETIRPLMSDAGLVCIPSQGERQEVVVETKGGETTIVKILHTFRFVDSEDGSQVEITVWGEGQDKMDKGSYKAFTGAQKYALLKTFQISTGDDPERDASHNGRRSKPARQKASKPESSDVTCPDCGGPAWDNRDDDKAAANGGKRPNFKCKDSDCDWASWDSDPPGAEPDPEPEDPWTVPKRKLNEALSKYISDRDERRRVAEGLAAIEDDLPDHIDEWMPVDFETAAELVREDGPDLLERVYEHLDEESQTEMEVA